MGPLPCPSRSIKFVGEYRITRGNQVEPNLMGPSRERPRLDQCSLPTGLQQPKGGLGLFALPLIHLHLSTLRSVRPKLQAAGPLCLFWDAADGGQIDLLHLSALKQIAVSSNRARALGQQQNSGGIGIEAVDETEVFQISRAGPEILGRDRGGQRRLEIPAGL